MYLKKYRGRQINQDFSVSLEEVQKCSPQFPPQFHINKLFPMNSRDQITRKIYKKTRKFIILTQKLQLRTSANDTLQPRSILNNMVVCGRVTRYFGRRVGYGETSILILRSVLLLKSGKCGESSWFDLCFLFNVPWGIP